MKTLSKIVMHGSRQSRATGWLLQPGFCMAHFTDGSTQYMGNISHDEAVAVLSRNGVNTTDYTTKTAATLKAMAYHDKPDAELYQHGYGYEKPTELGEWQWSTTFGRWSRLVTFADGWHGYTYPKTF